MGAKVQTNSAFECDMLVDEIFIHEIYNGGVIKYEDNQVILDIGANIGLFALYASGRANGLRVFSCEPIPQSFGLLAKNTRQIMNSDIKLFEVGIGSKKGHATFGYTPRFPCGTTAFPDKSQDKFEKDMEFTLEAFSQLNNPWLRKGIATLPVALRRCVAKLVTWYYGKTVKIECKMTTISDLIDENNLDEISLLKIDVEGAEVEALKGIRDEHWSRISQVCVETHYGDALYNATRDILLAKGYELTTQSNPFSQSYRVIYAVRNQT